MCYLKHKLTYSKSCKEPSEDSMVSRVQSLYHTDWAQMLDVCIWQNYWRGNPQAPLHTPVQQKEVWKYWTIHGVEQACTDHIPSGKGYAFPRYLHIIRKTVFVLKRTQTSEVTTQHCVVFKFLIRIRTSHQTSHLTRPQQIEAQHKGRTQHPEVIAQLTTGLKVKVV